MSGRAVATVLGPRRQARNSTALTDAVALASGARRGGAWRLVEYSPVDPGTYLPTDQRGLYGIAVVPLRRHRWIHVRAFAAFEGACTPADREDGTVARALERLLRTARVQARVV